MFYPSGIFPEGLRFLCLFMSERNYMPVWREKFQVRSFDIGLNAVMRISSICSFFQEIAGRHASHLDLGYQYMQSEGRVWVLSKLYMNILKRPAWGQEFFAETWPLGNERIFYRRDYRLDDGKETMVEACSYWLLLDLTSRKPVVVPIDQTVVELNRNRFAMQIPSEPFVSVAGDDYVIHKVKYSDLDQNRHVNNARYVEWAFDMIDQDMLEKKSPAFFSIEYKHETKAGDIVHLKLNRHDEPNTYLIEGVLEEQKQTCFRAKVVF
jgi:acyl-ACP thioesterase